MSEIMKTTERFLVEITIDHHAAQNFPDGVKNPLETGGDNGFNPHSYPNWDFNYRGAERDFIKGIKAELKKYSEYSGITVSLTKAK
jgi:hypothetical protein